MSNTFNRSKKPFPKFGQLTDPKRDVDPQIISLINVTVSDGDIQEIKNLVNNKKVQLDVRDSEGNTPIHYILQSENPNITDIDRYEIVKFLHRNGSPIDTFNKNNITPLHLSVLRGSYDITNYLLSKGADPNRADNSGMTPLHYAVQGETTECPRIETKRKKESIRETDTKQIKDIIISLLTKSSLSSYLNHIRNQLLNYDKMFIEDIMKLESTLVDDISKIASDDKLTDDQKKKNTDTRIYQLKQQIEEKLRSILSAPLKEMDIKPYATGWSPSPDSPKVVQDVNYMENIDNTEKKIREVAYLLSKDLSELDEVSTKNINSMEQAQKNQQLVVQHKNNLLANYGDIPDIRDLENQFSITYTDAEKDNIYLKNVELSDTTDVTFSDPNIDFLRVQKPKEDSVDVVPRLTKNETKRLSKTGVVIEPLPLSDDEGYKIIGANLPAAIAYANRNKPPAGSWIPVADLPPNHKLNVNDFLLYNFIDNKLTHISDMLYFMYRIRSQIMAMNLHFQHMFSVLLTQIDNDRMLYSVYSTYIPKVTENIVNILNNTLAIKNRLSERIALYKQLKTAINQASTSYTNIPYSYSFEYAEDYMNDILEALDTVSNSFDTTYSKLTTVYSNLNIIISIINKHSGIRQSYAYFNDKPVSNIFRYVLSSLSSLPPSFNEYAKRIGFESSHPDTDEIVRLALENFFIHISPADPATYFGKDIPGFPVSGLHKYDVESDMNLVGYNVDYNTERHARSGVLTDHPNPHVNLKYNGAGLDKNFVQTSVESADNILNPADASKKGVVGYKNLGDIDVNKNYALFSSLSSILGEHFENIRYVIVKEILSLIDNPDSPKIDMLKIEDADKNELKKIISDYRDKLQNVYGTTVDSDKILFIVFAKLTSKIIVSFLERKIDEAAVVAVKKIISDRSETLKDVVTEGGDIKNILRTDESPEIDLSYLKDMDILLEKIDTTLIANVDVTKPKTAKSDIYPDKDISYTRTSEFKDGCLKVDLKLINTLLASGADPNRVNTDRMTPLHYAIQNKISSLVKLLIDNGAKVSTGSVKSSQGLTPLTYLLNSLETTEFDKKVFYTNSLKKIEKGISGDSEFKNKIVDHMETAFEQILYMLNHHLFNLSRSYPKDWTYDDYKTLCILLQSNMIISTPCESNVPAILRLKPEKLEDALGLNTTLQPLNNKREELEDTLSELEDKQKSFMNSLESMQKEHGETDDINKMYLDGQIRRVKTELTKINNSIDTVKNRLEELNKNIKDNLTTTSRNVQDRIDAYTPTDRSAVNIYKNIFNRVINDVSEDRGRNMYTGLEDFKGYNRLWEIFLDSDLSNSIENIVFTTTKLESVMVKSPVVGRDTIKLIDKLYNSVFKRFAEDYLNLPQDDLSENYALETVYNIISHVVRHVICASLYISIIRATASYILSVTPQTGFTERERREYVKNLIKDMFETDGVLVPKMCNYIVGYMPKLVTRHILRLKHDITDEVNDVESVSQLINPIIDILINNSRFTISKDSQLIKEITEKIFPYYTDILTLSIPQFKIVVDNFMRYIDNRSVQTEMASVIIDKSINEV